MPRCGYRGARSRIGGRIPGNSLGQGFTSTGTLTHVWGAYRALTLCRRRGRGPPPAPSEHPIEHAIDVRHI